MRVTTAIDPAKTKTGVVVVEDQSRNGVRVIVTRFHGGGSVVEADCQCFGLPGRTHSSSQCPALKGGQR